MPIFNKLAASLSKKAVEQLPKVLVIGGPTGIGKTPHALELARALNGEIISVDAFQIYKYLNVGTAKPTIEERTEIPHYFIDEREPNERQLVGEYVDEVQSVLKNILERGKVPVICGGATFYLRQVITGSLDTPAPNLEKKKQIEQLLAEDNDWEKSLKRLEQIDPKAAQLITPRNYQRLSRYLEINASSGKNVDEFSFHSEPNPNYDWRCFTLLPNDRPDYYKKLDDRVISFFENGLLNEIVKLLRDGKLIRDTNPTYGIGYRHGIEFLDNKPYTDPKLRHTIDQVQSQTRNYAKQQITWFKNPVAAMFHTIDISPQNKVKETTNTILELFNTNLEEFKKIDTRAKERANPLSPETLQKLRTHQTPKIPDFVINRILQKLKIYK